MRYCYYELKKIWGFPLFLALLGVLCGIQMGYVFYDSLVEDHQGIVKAAIYRGNASKEQMALEKKQYEDRFSKYKEDLKKREVEGEKILRTGFYQEEPWTRADTRAHLGLIRSLGEIAPRKGFCYPQQTMLQNPVIPISLWLILLTGAGILVSQECLGETWGLVKATQGGYKYGFAAKYMALFLTGIACWGILFYVQLLSLYGTYGLLDWAFLREPIQLVDRFLYCPWKLTGFQLSLRLIGIRLLALAFGSGLVLTVASLVKNHVFMLLSVGGILGVQGLLYAKIQEFSFLKSLKYINIMTLFYPTVLYEKYRSFQFFGGLLLAPQTIFFFVILSVALFGAWAWRYRLLYPKDIQVSGKGEGRRQRIRGSAVYYECKKFFFGQKAAWVFLSFALMQSLVYGGYQERLTKEEYYCKLFSLEIEKLDEKEQVEFLRKREKFYDDIEKNMKDIQKKQEKGEVSALGAQILMQEMERERDGYNGFQKMRRHFEKAKQRGAAFLYQRPYEEIFQRDLWRRVGKIYVQGMSFFILAMASLYAMEKEHNMQCLLRCSWGKEKVLKAKRGLAAAGILFFYFGSFGVDLGARLYVYEGGGFLKQGKSLLFLTLPQFLGALPVWILLALWLCVLFGIFATMAWVALALQRRMENSLIATLIPAGVSVLPAVFFLFL